MQIIDDWLEDWVLKASLVLEDGAGAHDAQVFTTLTSRLGSDAEAAGYGRAELLDACGGRLDTFLESQIAYLRPTLAHGMPDPVTVDQLLAAE